MLKHHHYTISYNPIVIFFILIAFLSVIILIVTSPHISSLVMTNKRSSALQALTEHAMQEKYINAQEFWQTRDFYDVGHMTFAPDGIPQTTVKKLLSQMDASQFATQSGYVFLTYESPHVKSIESIIPLHNTLPLFFDSLHGELLFNTQNERIIQNGKTTRIVFIKSLQEMRTANGYVQFIKKPDLFKDSVWFSITQFSE